MIRKMSLHSLFDSAVDMIMQADLPNKKITILCWRGLIDGVLIFPLTVTSVLRGANCLLAGCFRAESRC